MSIYAKPRHVRDLSECYFYHTMDLPGVGTRLGNWDLRVRWVNIWEVSNSRASAPRNFSQSFRRFCPRKRPHGPSNPVQLAGP